MYAIADFYLFPGVNLLSVQKDDCILWLQLKIHLAELRPDTL